jgi:hypothetical protein
MLLIAIFVEFCVVTGRSQTQARSPQALSMAVLRHGLEKNGMVRAWHGKCESGMATLCKSNGKDTF